MTWIKGKIIQIMSYPNDETTNGIFLGDRNWYHLYIISNEEIKKKDWFYDARDKIVSNNSLSRTLLSKKIIATTDKSLKFGEDVPGFIKYKSLPQPSQQFIEEYIREYDKKNMITDVLIESQFSIYGSPDMCEGTDIIKVNPTDNTVHIKRIKDSWNREEVITLLNKSHLDRIENSHIITSDLKLSDKWIEENL